MKSAIDEGDKFSEKIWKYLILAGAEVNALSNGLPPLSYLFRNSSGLWMSKLYLILGAFDATDITRVVLYHPGRVTPERQEFIDKYFRLRDAMPLA